MDSPTFQLTNNTSLYYLIKVIKDKILCWEELDSTRYTTCQILPEKVSGGQDALMKLGIWDKLSTEAQTSVLNFVASNIVPVEPVTQSATVPSPMHLNVSVVPTVKRGRGRPRKVQPIITASSEPIVKRKRGRPRKDSNIPKV
jgi:hypothetical protein